MKNSHKLKSISLFILCVFFAVSYVLAQEKQQAIMKLDKNWSIQPSGEWSDDGQLITPDVYSLKNKISCDVSTTVFCSTG